MNEPDIIVGIDLGTTFSLVAYVDEHGPQVIRDEAGDGRVPSVLAVTARPDAPPQFTIGWPARRHAVENAHTTVYSVKRLIGKGLADLHAELPFLAYAVTAGPRDTVQIDIDGHRYTPEEISSAILRNLRQRAEAHLGAPVRRAVITVPAYFDDAQRQATRTAGQAAGLEVLRIINEPTAAALAYGIGARPHAPAATSGRGPHAVSLPLPTCPTAHSERGDAGRAQTVAVYDLGGGTFDISILRIEDGVFQVLSTAGDTHLGGDDFDRALITLVSDEVQEQFNVGISAPATKQALRSLAEAVKIRVGEQPEARIELDLGTGRSYQRTISRTEFEERTAPLVQRTLGLCDRALRDAGLDRGAIDRFILVGGATRMPAVRRAVEAFLARPPYTALNPDEVVALGAAIQASMLAGRQPDMLLLDVTPLSLGIETMGGAMGKLILRNTTVPCRATEMFTTFVDGQTAIKLNVLQGERELARDCRSLGEFVLRDLPPMPAGLPKIEVEFLIDANGILNVAARELRSGRAAGIQIIPNHGLTREEVERITRESVAHAQADVDAHRRIDLLNQIAFDIHKTRQMLAKVGQQLDETERAAIERNIAELEGLAKRAQAGETGTPSGAADADGAGVPRSAGDAGRAAERASPQPAAGAPDEAADGEPIDLDALYAALTRFGHGTRRLAELGITAALQERERSRE